VNTSASWPDPETAALRVRRMQRKLHHWAVDDSGRCFDDVFNLVYDPAFLTVAWERVRTNKGARSAGTDGVVPRFLGSEESDRMLETLYAQVKGRRFRPDPVREVMIPKSSGKMRRLGIATAADRVVQASLKLVLNLSSRPISGRVVMGFGRGGVLRTRSPRFTTSPGAPAPITGCSRVTSRRVSTRSTTPR
jgi:RNA-directed DNA polymerase